MTIGSESYLVRWIKNSRHYKVSIKNTRMYDVESGQFVPCQICPNQFVQFSANLSHFWTICTNCNLSMWIKKNRFSKIKKMEYVQCRQ